MIEPVKTHNFDTLFRWSCFGCAAIAGVLMLGFFIQLASASTETWRTFGPGFILSAEWDPAAGKFGADEQGNLCFLRDGRWLAVRTVEYAVDRVEPVLP